MLEHDGKQKKKEEEEVEDPESEQEGRVPGQQGNEN